MTNWADIQHCYGSAEDIPALLDALTPDRSSEAWSDLWGCVCHQGSVYAASAAVLPHLRALAQQWTPVDRLQPLVLAGAIVASNDPSADFDIAPFRQDIDELAALADDALTTTGLTQEDFIYLMQASLALHGHAQWGRHLDRMCDGERFHARCPSCDADLEVALQPGGVSHLRLEGEDEADGNAIEPTPPAALTGIGQRLHRLATSDQQDVADKLCSLFGHAACPACAQRLPVADAIAKGDE